MLDENPLSDVVSTTRRLYGAFVFWLVASGGWHNILRGWAKIGTPSRHVVRPPRHPPEPPKFFGLQAAAARQSAGSSLVLAAELWPPGALGKFEQPEPVPARRSGHVVRRLANLQPRRLPRCSPGAQQADFAAACVRRTSPMGQARGPDRPRAWLVIRKQPPAKSIRGR